MSTILHTDKLCKSFSNGGLQQHIIKNLDLEIREKDFTVIMGASGSGKSTLLYALSGMDSGDAYIKGYFTDGEAFQTSSYFIKRDIILSMPLSIRNAFYVGDIPMPARHIWKLGVHHCRNGSIMQTADCAMGLRLDPLNLIRLVPT